VSATALSPHLPQRSRLVAGAALDLTGATQAATSFETVLPACKVIFGAGASGRAGAEVAALGAHRVLFVCSPSLLATPQAASIRKSFGDRLVAKLNDVRAHVPSDLVPAGRRAATPT
jgi:alcohol dehydrogenase class IV